MRPPSPQRSGHTASPSLGSRLRTVGRLEIPNAVVFTGLSWLLVCTTVLLASAPWVQPGWGKTSSFAGFETLLPSFLDPAVHTERLDGLDALSYAARPDEERGPARSYVLLVIDSWRYDHAPPAQAGLESMPFLSELHRGGELRCSRESYAAANWTRPTTASLLTGVHSYRHGFGITGLRAVGASYDDVSMGIIHKTGHIPPGRTAAEQLAALRGFDTVMLSSNYIPAALGEGRFAFSRQLDVISDAGEPVVEAFLSRVRGSDAPFFAYLHLNVVHTPRIGRSYDGRYGDLQALARRTHTHPSAFELYGQSAIDPNLPEIHTNQRYRYHHQHDEWFGDVLEGSMIRYRWTLTNADASIRSLFEGLEAMGRLEDTVVFVTSDHGEGFYETQALQERQYLIMPGPGVGHAKAMFDEETRVPLCVYNHPLPPDFEDRLTHSVDIPATLLADAGIQATGLDGLDIFADTWPRERAVLSEAAGATFRKLALARLDAGGSLQRTFFAPFEPDAEQLDQAYHGHEPRWVYPMPNGRSCLVQSDHAQPTPCTEDDLKELRETLGERFTGHPFARVIDQIENEPRQQRMSRGRDIVCVYGDDPACAP